MNGQHEAPSKWSKNFLVDWFERWLSVFGYSVVTLLVTYNFADLKALGMDELWPVLFLPAILSALKGLLANMANPESGASLLPSPPGPDVNVGDDDDDVPLPPYH